MYMGLTKTEIFTGEQNRLAVVLKALAQGLRLQPSQRHSRQVMVYPVDRGSAGIDGQRFGHDLFITDPRACSPWPVLCGTIRAGDQP